LFGNIFWHKSVLLYEIFFLTDIMICYFQNLFTNHQPFVVRFHFDHTMILTLLKRNTHIKVYCHSIKFQKAQFYPNDFKAEGEPEDTSSANTSTPLHVFMWTPDSHRIHTRWYGSPSPDLVELQTILCKGYLNSKGIWWTRNTISRVIPRPWYLRVGLALPKPPSFYHSTYGKNPLNV
jgi:hypothetical protein